LTTRTVLLVIYLQDNCKLKHTGCTRNDSSMKRDGGSRPLHACIFFASGFTVAVQHTGERRNRAVRIRSGCICRGAGCVGLSAEQFAFFASVEYRGPSLFWFAPCCHLQRSGGATHLFAEHAPTITPFYERPPGNPRHLLVGLGAYTSQGAEQLLPKHRLSPGV
jgi:hypothetical protein